MCTPLIEYRIEQAIQNKQSSGTYNGKKWKNTSFEKASFRNIKTNHLNIKIVVRQKNIPYSLQNKATSLFGTEKYIFKYSCSTLSSFIITQFNQ